MGSKSITPAILIWFPAIVDSEKVCLLQQKDAEKPTEACLSACKLV